MLLLRLVALNFLDAPVHLKPLFEDLDYQLTTAKEKTALRNIAQEVAHRQAYRLTVRSGNDEDEVSYDSGPQQVKPGQTLHIPDVLTSVHIESVSVDGIRAKIVSEPIDNRAVGPFLVTYFDAPLVDNTKLGDNRIALLLDDSGAEGSKIRVIVFPNYRAADRIDIKELARVFRSDTQR